MGKCQGADRPSYTFQKILTGKIGNFFYGKKVRENSVVLHCLVVDKFDFTRKIVIFFVGKIRDFFWFYAK